MYYSLKSMHDLSTSPPPHLFLPPPCLSLPSLFHLATVRGFFQPSLYISSNFKVVIRIFLKHEFISLLYLQNGHNTLTKWYFKDQGDGDR